MLLGYIHSVMFFHITLFVHIAKLNPSPVTTTTTTTATTATTTYCYCNSISLVRMSVGAFVMLFHVVTAWILGRFPIVTIPLFVGD